LILVLGSGVCWIQGCGSTSRSTQARVADSAEAEPTALPVETTEHEETKTCWEWFPLPFRVNFEENDATLRTEEGSSAPVNPLLCMEECTFDFVAEGLVDGSFLEYARIRGEIEILKIQGHASHGETEPMKLSERRARNVADELVKRGFPRELVQTEGYGDERPITADVMTPRWMNRRVEAIARITFPPDRCR